MPAYVKLKVRLAIWERDDYKCAYCGCQVFVNARECAPDKATLDHVHPRSRGGTNAQSNLVTACYDCNQRKADREAIVSDGVPAPTLGAVWPTEPVASEPT